MNIISENILKGHIIRFVIVVISILLLCLTVILSKIEGIISSEINQNNPGKLKK